MPSLQIQVGVEHHVTLFHWDALTEVEELMVDDIMIELMKKVKTRPNGVFGPRTMMGQYRNVKAIKIQSRYLEQCREFLAGRFAQAGLKWSKDLDGGTWTPHVSRPFDEWQPGTPVPFATFMQFNRSGGAVRAHYELVAQYDGTPLPY